MCKCNIHFRVYSLLYHHRVPYPYHHLLIGTPKHSAQLPYLYLSTWSLLVHYSSLVRSTYNIPTIRSTDHHIDYHTDVCHPMTRPFALSAMVSLPFITTCTPWENILTQPVTNAQISLVTSTSHPQLRGKASLLPLTRRLALSEKLHRIAMLYDTESRKCGD